jgi:hypothetical protein
MISSLASTFGNQHRANNRWTSTARSKRARVWYCGGHILCHTRAESGMDLPCSVEQACRASRSPFPQTTHASASSDLESTVALACRAADHVRQRGTNASISPLDISLIGVCTIFDQVVSKMCPRSRWMEAGHLEGLIAEAILAKQIGCGFTIYRVPRQVEAIPACFHVQAKVAEVF